MLATRTRDPCFKSFLGLFFSNWPYCYLVECCSIDRTTNDTEVGSLDLLMAMRLIETLYGTFYSLHIMKCTDARLSSRGLWAVISLVCR